MSFFERAFDVLFYKHDATKQTSFRRKFRTALAIDDFRSIFSTFSAFTYLDHGSSFTNQQAIKCAGAALEYNDSSEKAEAFLSDLCTSVSVLIREGDIYNYIHRSMQEFFVAQFLALRELEQWDSIVERIVRDRPNDSVVRQLADINRDKFERQFLSHRISAIRKEVQDADPDRNPSKIFQLFFITFSFRGDSISSWMVGRGDERPPWYYMTGFIEETRGFRQRLEFDWASHFRSRRIGVIPESGGAFQLVNVSDSALVGTPMVDYVKHLREAVISMDEKLKASSEKQKRLVSTALLKKRSNEN